MTNEQPNNEFNTHTQKGGLLVILLLPPPPLRVNYILYGSGLGDVDGHSSINNNNHNMLIKKEV